MKVVFEGPVHRTGKRPATQHNRTGKDWTSGCGCVNPSVLRLPVATLRPKGATGKKPVATGLSWLWIRYHSKPTSPLSLSPNVSISTAAVWSLCSNGKNSCWSTKLCCHSCLISHPSSPCQALLPSPSRHPSSALRPQFRLSSKYPQLLPPTHASS
jgi:hypothetical protein